MYCSHRNNIPTEIQRLTAEIAQDAKLDVQYVIDGLIRNREMAVEAGKLSESNNALELPGKHLGIWQADQGVTAEDRLVAFKPGISVEDYLSPVTDDSQIHRMRD